MEPLYLDLFEDKKSVERYFGPDYDEPLDLSYADIAIAHYGYDSYDGYAFVLYKDTRDGKWYEVHGSHGSYYGLEDQWSPEEVEPKAIVKRNAYSGYDSDDPVQKVIGDRIKQLFPE